MKVIPDRAEFDGSPQPQHVGDKIAWECEYLTAPDSVVSVTVYNAAGVAQASMIEGSPTLSGTTVTTPLIVNVTDGNNFRVVVTITRGGNTLNNYFWLNGAL